MDNTVYRIIDANINRLREGMRVVEDIVRFQYENKNIFTRIKTIRHSIEALSEDILESLLQARESIGDVGQKSVTKSEIKRQDIFSILRANLVRAQESLRVLEELFKSVDVDKSEKAKAMRFEVYSIEKELLLMVGRE